MAPPLQVSLPFFILSIIGWMGYIVGFGWLVHNGYEDTSSPNWFPFCCFAAMGPLLYMLAFVQLTSGKKHIGILVSSKDQYTCSPCMKVHTLLPLYMLHVINNCIAIYYTDTPTLLLRTCMHVKKLCEKWYRQLAFEYTLYGVL